jgi:cell division protein FtsL
LKPTHQRFAEEIAIGTPNGKAYAIAFGKPGTSGSVDSAARRLAAAPHIIAKVAELRQRAAARSEEAAVLTLTEKRIFLARIVRTAVTALDEKGDTKDLIKKISVRSIGSGENSEQITEIEGYDKIKAISEDTALAGDGAESEHLRALNTLLAGIPIDGMIKPTDSMD